MGDQDVYDLTVEGETFIFSNGIISHNSNPEPCLLAIFKDGKKHAPSAPVAVRNERNLLFAPLRAHSQKPLEAYDKINRLYPNAWPPVGILPGII